MDRKSKRIFQKHFPQFKFKFFTCHSELLDFKLREFLKEDSNIIKFQNLFNIVSKENSNEGSRFLFKWNADTENIEKEVSDTYLKKFVKDEILKGEAFYIRLGVIKI